MPTSPTKSRRSRIFLKAFGALALGYALLLIPEGYPPAPAGAGKQAFLWNRDAFWTSLQTQYESARSIGCDQLATQIDTSIRNLDLLLNIISAERREAADGKFALLETNLFRLAPMIAACPGRFTDYLQLVTRVREVVKRQSEGWNMNSAADREQVYRLLYGSRAALEEVILQAPKGIVPALVLDRDELSPAPFTNILGVAIHSGDILVSRGGAPTSALIARGNDYPGNFSHIALVHVDEDTRAVSIIEAHIEQGVLISSVADYLRDRKLRVMVLRLRADLPQLTADPMLPHKAASAALIEARAGHIPYDFEMDYREHSKRFCSEVASAPYERFGVNLWTGISHISSPGITSWLAAFGVKYFETQEPSDLEYDPQLRVVAEWRDPETLFEDHADNAVIDVMLEAADAGERLDHSWHLLPVVRVLKAYSVMRNWLGGAGPIPEGMSATAALRNKTFSRKHQALKSRLLALADEFRNQRGYTPPYWDLLRLAGRAKRETEAK